MIFDNVRTAEEEEMESEEIKETPVISNERKAYNLGLETAAQIHDTYGKICKLQKDTYATEFHKEWAAMIRQLKWTE